MSNPSEVTAPVKLCFSRWNELIKAGRVSLSWKKGWGGDGGGKIRVNEDFYEWKE